MIPSELFLNYESLVVTHHAPINILPVGKDWGRARATLYRDFSAHVSKLLGATPILSNFDIIRL